VLGVAILIALGALAARVEARPRAGESWSSWYGDGADDRELAAEAAADQGESGRDVSVSSADAVVASAAIDPFADPVSLAALVPAAGASSFVDPLATAGDPDDPSGRLRRRSRWGALDITLLVRRQWTLPDGGTPATWNAVWVLATWRH
jgi:hypothetical protein